LKYFIRGNHQFSVFPLQSLCKYICRKL